jgi:hypothetical protein
LQFCWLSLPRLENPRAQKKVEQHKDVDPRKLDSVMTMIRYIENGMRETRKRNNTPLAQAKKYLTSYQRTGDTYWYDRTMEELNEALVTANWI